MNQSNQWHEARNTYYAHKSQAICHDLDFSKGLYGNVYYAPDEQPSGYKRWVPIASQYSVSAITPHKKWVSPRKKWVVAKKCGELQGLG